MTPSADLAAPRDLERICRGLAALEAILCAEWQDRYYSFDPRWGDGRNEERMASMRNGCGDEWFIVFAPGGAFVKAFWHEYPHEDPDVIYAGLPKALATHRTEPAFSMQYVTWGGWYANGWTLRGNAEPIADELAMLRGNAETYRAFVADYYERDVPLDPIREVLTGAEPHAEIVARIAPERDFADVRDELAEIYGRK